MKHIDGVQVNPLKIIADQRGMLGEILRCDDERFQKFGQVYFTTAYSGVVKAWHRHIVQTDYFTCIVGLVKLALHDNRFGSPTKGEFNTFIIGPRNPNLIVIPPGIWHGFMGVRPEEAVMINVPTEPYNYDKPDEERAPWNIFDYEWENRNG